MSRNGNLGDDVLHRARAVMQHLWDETKGLEHRVYTIGYRLLKQRGDRSEKRKPVIDPDSVGEVRGSLLWRATDRGLHAWSVAWAAVTTGPTKRQEVPTRPGTVTRTQVDAGEGGPQVARGDTAKVRPARDGEFAADDRYDELEASVPPQGDALPKGTPGVVLLATDEREQVALFLPAGYRLVAVNRAGDPSISSLVSDLTAESEIDQDRRAPLHSALRVIRLAPGSPVLSGDQVLAHQLTTSGQDGISGHGLWYGRELIATPQTTPPPKHPDQQVREDEQAVTSHYGKITGPHELIDRLQRATQQGEGDQHGGATVGGGQTRERARTQDQLDQTRTRDQTREREGEQTRERPQLGYAVGATSAEAGGPFDVGGPDCPHQVGATQDGETIRSMHLSTDAYFRGAGGDGPFLFEGGYEDPGPQPWKSRAHIAWDAAFPHPHPTGNKPGRWRVWSESLLIPPEEEETWLPPEGDPPPLGDPPGGGPPRGDPPPGGGAEGGAGDSGPQGWTAGYPGGDPFVEGHGIPTLPLGGSIFDAPKTLAASRTAYVRADVHPDERRRFAAASYMLAAPGIALRATPYAQGEVDYTRSSELSRDARRKLQRLPLTLEILAHAAGDGTALGYQADMVGRTPVASAGGAVVAPPGTTLQQVLAQEETGAAKIWLPPGMQLGFGYPDPRAALLGGIAVGAAGGSLVFDAYDGGGNYIRTPLIVGEGGIHVIGNLSVSGKLNVAGSIDPTDLQLDPQPADPIEDDAYGFWVSDGTEAGTEEGGLYYQRAGARVRLDVSGGGGGVTPVDLAPGRLTLSSTDPVADIASSLELYYLPYRGHQIALYDGSAWGVHSIGSGLTKSFSGLSESTNYDVFLFDNAGTLALEFVAWASDTARDVALARQDGVWVQSGDPTRRYLGSFRTIAGIVRASRDNALQRFVYNVDNKVRRSGTTADSTSSWDTTGTTQGAINSGAAAWKHEVINGLPEDEVEARAGVLCSLSAMTIVGPTSVTVAFGVDGLSTHAGCLAGTAMFTAVSANVRWQPQTSWAGRPGVGYHYLQATAAKSSGLATITAYGSTPLSRMQSSSWR